MLGPHEVAHQWWGQWLGWKTYHDEWLSEGLSEFSASLFLENAYSNDAVSNRRSFLEFWRRLRERLLAGLDGANRPPGAQYHTGPISLGMRLNDIGAGSYRTLVYAKGAFLVHMLRFMMMDPHAQGPQREARFSSMIQAFVKDFGGKNPSTRDFQGVAERFMTPEMDLGSNGRLDWLVDEWWGDTELPHYDLTYRIRGEGEKYTVWFRVKQQQVGPRFRMLVPLYADYGKGETRRIGVARLIGTDTSESEIRLAQRPLKLLLCANEDVLCTKTEKRLNP